MSGRPDQFLTLSSNVYVTWKGPVPGKMDRISMLSSYNIGSNNEEINLKQDSPSSVLIGQSIILGSDQKIA